MELQQTSRLELAARFINTTGSHVFLTGKAGTGKTTFLRQLAEKTHKSFLVVAPTGIAALNAGGVTIHSQFLFPFGSFIPEHDVPGILPENAPFHTRKSLTRMHPLNLVRKKVLRATDLLIIDEVSMLRADILDAIDFRMRRAKGDPSRSFGGTQLLMIGDLHQLPPIVKEEEWSVLRNYYRSMHFFEARALRENGMVYIELDKIFRQQDDRFISVLNRLRDNRATAGDIELLNSHYRERPSMEGDPIIITTHNRTADGINSGKLEALPDPSSWFEAEVEGDFPEKLFPLPQRIELKPGMQLMFIRNDSGEEKAYVNGSLARVIRIRGDEVCVEMKDDGSEYILKKEKWENKRYVVDKDSNEVSEDVIGTFGQYPVRPAWAVTVHKSQGLTFDRAVIDVGQAFAPGQVYVALSRLRSLDGLILRTRIHPSCIMSDTQVNAFSGAMKDQPLPELLDKGQGGYLRQELSSTFEFSGLISLLEGLQKLQGEKMEFEDREMREVPGKLKEAVFPELRNTFLFRQQLSALLQSGNRDFFMERLEKGQAYYMAFLLKHLETLLVHLAEAEQLTRTKTYRNALEEIEQLIMVLLGRTERVAWLARKILNGENIEIREGDFRSHVESRKAIWARAQEAARENPKFRSGKSGRKRKKGAKPVKGESARITWASVKEGRKVAEIARMRDLARSTVEGHVVKGIREGEVDISEVLDQKRIEEIASLIHRSKGDLKEARKRLKGKYTQGELRMVHAHLF